MIAGIKIDTREFNQALKECIRHSSRIPSLVVNSQGYHLARRALQYTKHADSSKIAGQLGQVATRVFGRRNKQFVRLQTAKRVFGKEDTYAHRIINARRRDRGEPMVWGKELDKEAKKFRAAVLRSVNFIRSGWIPAMRKLLFAARDSIAKGGKWDPNVKKRGRDKGGAVPARKDAWLAVCEIFNTAILPKSKFSKRAGQPMKYALDGLQRAMRESVADMRRHVEMKVKELDRKFSAR